jgi:hypothetical protein
MKRVEMARNHYIGVYEDTANQWRKKRVICNERALLGKVQGALPLPRDRFQLARALIPWTTLKLLHNGFIRNQLFWKSTILEESSKTEICRD